MKWSEALKIYNAGKGMYCMPRRGTPEHAAVYKIMGREPPGAKKAAAPAAPPAAPMSHKMEAPVVAMTATERGTKASEAREKRHPPAKPNPDDYPRMKKEEAAPKKTKDWEYYHAKFSAAWAEREKARKADDKAKEEKLTEKIYDLADKLKDIDRGKTMGGNGKPLLDSRLSGAVMQGQYYRQWKKSGKPNTGLMKAGSRHGSSDMSFNS